VCASSSSVFSLCRTVLPAAAALSYSLHCDGRGNITTTDVGCMLCGGVGLAFHAINLLHNGDVCYPLSENRRIMSMTLGEKAQGSPLPRLPERHVPWHDGRRPAPGGASMTNNTAGEAGRADTYRLAVARLDVVLYCGLHSLGQGVCRVRPSRAALQ
jgi:hypothetical protein